MPLNPDPRSPLPGFSPHIPGCFTSLEEARNSLYYQRNRCLRTAHECRHTLADQVMAGTMFLGDEEYIKRFEESGKFFQDTFGKWARAFQAFLDKYSATLDSTSLQGAATLKIHQLIATLSIESYKERGPLIQETNNPSWDKYRSECEEIVNLATTIVQMQSTPSSSPKASGTKAPIFSLDVNIVSPLYIIAHRCRDPVIRRRAISLLYSAPRQEGLWHSVVTAHVCEKIMLVEEAGLGEVKTCEDIPQANRIAEVDVKFNMEGRKGYLTLIRNKDIGLEPGNIFEELIEW